MAKDERNWVKMTNDTNTDVWDYRTEGKGATFIGVYTGRKDGLGPENSTMWLFEGEDNKPYGVWDSAVLRSRLSELTVGDEIKIEYLGLEAGDKGRSYHNFDIYKNE